MNRALTVFISFIFISLFAMRASAQGKINGPVIVCQLDIVNYSYTPPSGLTVSSIAWDFGDGYTSGGSNPSHAYTQLGKLTIHANVSFTNSTTLNDSLPIEVFGLPKAAFYLSYKTDTCFNRNKVRFIDTSSPAVSGQTITNRLFVWGDGNFTNKVNPKKFDSSTYTYSIIDKYTLRMEITDKIGCKNSVSRDITILKTINAAFTLTTNFVSCYKAQVCVKNNSNGYPIQQGRYRWYADTSALDTNAYISSSKCVQYNVSRNGSIKLLAFVYPQCVDTFKYNFKILIDSLPKTMYLQDTSICFSENGQNEASIANINRDDIRWYVDNQLNMINKLNSNYFGTKKTPGVYPVRVEIVRGSCVTTLTRNFRVKGPIASFNILDGFQCFSNRDVFMVDKSKGIKRDNCTFYWEITDPNGANCIQQRTKDINKYTNCNKSLDWFDKHRFKKGSLYRVFFMVTDTTNGCMDTLSKIVDMTYCSPILIPDTFNMCQNKGFLENSTAPFPKFFNLDSGKWRPFGSTLDTTYSGLYKLGYIFETIVPEWAEHYGDDSLLLHTDTMEYYDTVYRKQILRVNKLKEDSVSMTVSGTCKPFKVTVHLKKGIFKKKEGIDIYWGDSGNYLRTFYADSTLDSVSHYYNSKIIQSVVRVVIRSAYGCEKTYLLPVNKGKSVSVFTPYLLNCKKDKVCFTSVVYDAVTNSYWTGNTPKQYVQWIFPDTNGVVTRWNPCVQYQKGGLRQYKMIVRDSFGCADTLQDSVFIQDVKAGIRTSSHFIYCSELKLFQDSSSFFRNPKYRNFLPKFYVDTIKTYSWQFGKGVFSSQVKNPLQSINTSLDSITASLAVTTVLGCTDTLRFTIKVIGSKPYFQIRDTIGCGSLTATFINKSRNCKQYIWQLGDSANTQFQTSDMKDLPFTYTKPGRYFISLIGIDTVFNPFTNKLQYCYNTFPDKVFQKDTVRSVLVLPFKKTAISSGDTICVGLPMFLSSRSDFAYDYDHWNLGDSTGFDTTEGNSIVHKYKKAGIYTVKLNPYYNTALNNFCRDSAQKQIVVMGVKADFTIDPNSIAPVFKFHNTSQPAFASIKWDFGQSGSADNSSTDQNPQKNYGTDTGSYTVCLIASIPYGCKDTICKILFNDYLSDFGIYNVFTPGKLDGLNDKYDIQIEGETLYDLKIYDRWGVLVFQGDKDSDNSSDGNWNGKVFNTGAECAGGTYYYIFRYSLKTKPNEVQTIQGVIHLIR